MNQDFTLVEDDGFEISINVVNPQEIKTTMSSYTTYTLKGQDKQGIIQVARRYSDFDAMRLAMLQRWPGCFVPPLPGKKLINKTDPLFVQQRRRFLQIFLIKLAKLKHLWYSNEFQVFLRTTNVDVQKTLKNLAGQTNQQLITKYEQKFSKLSGKQINTLILAKIANFSSYIKKTLPMISNFKEMIHNFLELRSKHNDQFDTFLTFLMPEYEKNCLSQYVNNNIEGKFIFGETSDERLLELVNNMKNFLTRTEFRELYDILQLEERQIEAFIEIFKLKEGYQQKLEDYKQKEKDLNLDYQKLMAGKVSLFKSIFKSNIEENKKQVQLNIEKIKLEKENFVFICDISTVILGHFQIDRFKQEKSTIYFKTLRRIGECEREFTAIKTAIFQHILQNHNLV